jgi:uncharacterized protein (DUF2461 family)
MQHTVTNPECTVEVEGRQWVSDEGYRFACHDSPVRLWRSVRISTEGLRPEWRASFSKSFGADEVYVESSWFECPEDALDNLRFRANRLRELVLEVEVKP